MTLISIREREEATTAKHFAATLMIEAEGEYAVTLCNPFSDKEEQSLSWYFEEWIRYPFLKEVQAQEASASISAYGEALFQQMFFADPYNPAYAAYKACSQNGLNTLQFEIIGSPAFHQIHWEALKDPKLPRSFALEATMVRKNVASRALQANMRAFPTINVLLVTARPSGRLDVGYRTISRPLIELLRTANLRVQVEILRPGTYKALDQHLRKVRNQQGTGYYHIIHFDVHGALLMYDEAQKIISKEKQPQPNSHLYQQRYGRNDLAAYQGHKAFLSLESETDAQSDLVEARELANLLQTHQIPIAILNACQSGKQIGASETSLGSHLMQAGVQIVLAMSYSVSVSAAELMMRTLYQELFAGQDLQTAIRQARTELYNDKNRVAYFNQSIDLEDWLLPVVYQHQPQRIRTREFTLEEANIYYEHRTARYKEPTTSYGFVGRDLDILSLEKRLLTQRNIVLIQGMGGTGKTTLLHYLGSWWQTTGFVEHVFYFGYDQQTWTRQQILIAIAKQLLDQVAYLRDFQQLITLDAQQAMIADLLRAKRHLLILDNLESITGVQLAIQHTLPAEEQAALHRFLSDLSGGHTLVLLGSRSSEAWLARGTFEENCYKLPGLDPEAATTLVERILERHNATRYRTNKDLLRLMKLLDGFPLALQVVLANLAHQTPQEVLAALQMGDVVLDKTGANQSKAESILRCIEYSYSNLIPEVQQLLMCLSPFTSVIPIMFLDQYTEKLRLQTALAELPFERWVEAIEEAKQWGLFSPHEVPGYLHIQPILPYFLHSRLMTDEQAEVKRAIETAYRTFYEEVGNILHHFITSKEPKDLLTGQRSTELEYENLSTALKLALEAQVSIRNLYPALSIYLNRIQNHQYGLELAQSTLGCLELYPREMLDGPLAMDYTTVLYDIASRHRELMHIDASEESYKRVLALHLENKSLDSSINKESSAPIYHQLGVVAMKRRDWSQAEKYFQQALKIKIEFNDRYAQTVTYYQLGVMAIEQRRWPQAEQYCLQTLEIHIEFNDRHGQANAYDQLGRIALEQRHWPQAEKYFKKALEIYIEFDDRHAQAGIYHLLGRITEEQEHWPQAEQYYLQTLEIHIELNDRHAQAGTYHQLGMVAQKQRHGPQAEKYCQKALQIHIESNDRYARAATYHLLGTIALEQHHWSQAQSYYLQALEIVVDYKDDNRIAFVLAGLAHLWRASNDTNLPTVVSAIIDMTKEGVELFFQEVMSKEEGEKK